jgi:hypothetical protein
MNDVLVSMWVPNMCRNDALESQILVLLGVLRVCLYNTIEICIQHGQMYILVGAGCDEGGKGVQLVAQIVSEWGPEIADSSTV